MPSNLLFAGLLLVRDMCKATLQGGQLGAIEITFKPTVINGGKYFADCKTAGLVVIYR